MDKKQYALSCIQKGFNYAQATFSAFADDIGISRDTALKISFGFGGGMKCGSVCGTVTGALMAIGMKYGNIIENNLAVQMPAYGKTLGFINAFKEKEGCLLCSELLGYDTSKPEEMKKEIEKGLHISVCMKAIYTAIDIAEETMKEQSVTSSSPCIH